jgi:dinuclear metal center YbgI/SA1388 family protein
MPSRSQTTGVALAQIVAFADGILSPAAFQDYEGAQNGLQFENRGFVHRVGAAVDGSLTVARKAVDAGCDLLLVHHGLFWGKTTPWIGRRAGLIRCLVEGNLAVYSQHLPLDGHPRIGNAAGLAHALGFRSWRPFFARHDQFIGVQVVVRQGIPREELGRRLASVLGDVPRLLPGGPEVCRKIGICTGGAGSELPQAAREGVDTFITGEGPHWTYALAEDVGINAFYGGHYATETFGVRALAERISRKFGIPSVFIDHPTGL